LADKILVVDDEPDILNLALTILEAHGYQVVNAPDGESALQKVEVETPDLVLMDVVMPGKSGIEVCKLLKSKAKTKYIPIILFSVLGRDVDFRMAKEAGAANLFGKPFTEESLTEAVKKYLHEARWEKFSRQLGTDHKGLLGRKILIEYEPSAHYERLVRDFTNECVSHAEAAIVLTRVGNPVYNAVEGDEGIERVTQGMPTPMLSELLKGREKKQLGIVFDSITDLVVGRGMQSAYQYLQNAIGVLVSQPTTVIFLLNPSAHEQTVSHSLRGLFGNRATYGKEGLVAVALA
jgi:CheY-like chemotaxis protein